MTTDTQVDEFLAHYGKKGMKWGHHKSGEVRSEKQLARMNRRADKGDKLLAKSGGSAKSAALKIVGRRVAIGLGTSMAQMALTALPENATAIKYGASAALNLLNQGMFVKDVVDTTRLVSATRRRADS